MSFPDLGSPRAISWPWATIRHNFLSLDFVSPSSNIACRPLIIYKTYTEARSGDDAISGSTLPKKFVLTVIGVGHEQQNISYPIWSVIGSYRQPIEDKTAPLSANIFFKCNVVVRARSL